jgi:hypothetical protein
VFAAFAAAPALAGGVGFGSADDKPRQEKPARGRLEGTWEHTFEDRPERRQVKIINQTHFVWVTYERADGKPLFMGGGTYTFDGKTYKEQYEFGGPGQPAELVGKEQTFTAELDGDSWTHAGTLSNDFVVEEIWHRVRDGAVKPAPESKPDRDRFDAPLTAPKAAARGEPATPLTPPVAAAVPASRDRSRPAASSPPNTGSRLHPTEPPAIDKINGADLPGNKVTFQVTVGSGSQPLELRGWFTITSIPHVDAPSANGDQER